MSRGAPNHQSNVVPVLLQNVGTWKNLYEGNSGDYRLPNREIPEAFLKGEGFCSSTGLVDANGCNRLYSQARYEYVRYFLRREGMSRNLDLGTVPLVLVWTTYIPPKGGKNHFVDGLYQIASALGSIAGSGFGVKPTFIPFQLKRDHWQEKARDLCLSSGFKDVGYGDVKGYLISGLQVTELQIILQTAHQHCRGWPFEGNSLKFVLEERFSNMLMLLADFEMDDTLRMGLFMHHMMSNVESPHCYAQIVHKMEQFLIGQRVQAAQLPQARRQAPSSDEMAATLEALNRKDPDLLASQERIARKAKRRERREAKKLEKRKALEAKEAAEKKAARKAARKAEKASKRKAEKHVKDVDNDSGSDNGAGTGIAHQFNALSTPSRS